MFLIRMYSEIPIEKNTQDLQLRIAEAILACFSASSIQDRGIEVLQMHARNHHLGRIVVAFSDPIDESQTSALERKLAVSLKEILDAAGYTFAGIRFHYEF